MPVAIDVEWSAHPNRQGRADKLDKNTRTRIVKAFCNQIQNLGYTPLIYLNVDWAKNYVNMDELTSYDTWIAHYTNASSPSYTRPYAMWQYTSTGYIGGINGYVDLNYCYKKY